MSYPGCHTLGVIMAGQFPTSSATLTAAQMNFPELFQTATGHPPYDWQVRLACGVSHGQSSNLSGTPCRSLLINIPTGLGKTAGVVLAWLWNRLRQIPNLKCPMNHSVQSSCLVISAHRIPARPDIKHFARASGKSAFIRKMAPGSRWRIHFSTPSGSMDRTATFHSKQKSNH